MSTLTIAAPLRELKPLFEQSTGIPLEIELGPTALLIQRLVAATPPDAISLSKEKLDEFVAKGMVVPETAVDLVLSSVGIGVRAGAPKPAISTVDEVKAALLKAKGVAYSRAGASGLFFAGLIQRLGIADQINARATIVPEGFTGEVVVRGAAEIAIQQVSELMYVSGIDVVGPLPREVESRAVFSVGVMAAAPHRANAVKLMAFLTSRVASAVIRRYGLDPLAKP